MRRALGLLAVGVVAAVAAAAGTAALQDDPDPRVAPTTSTTEAVAPPSLPPPTTGTTGPALLLAWRQGGMPASAVEAAAAVPGVRAVAVVHDGRLDLVRSEDADGAEVEAHVDGWRIPLEAIAVDPAAYAEVVPSADRSTVAGLRPDEALLGETSARLRRLDAGGRIELADGTVLTVVGVVPDEAVGAAELVVHVATGAALGVDSPRALLVAHDTDRAAVESAIAATGVASVRFRAPGETPFLRAADAVLPQALVKSAFGEFAYRPMADGSDDVEVDPEWAAATIVAAEVPVLGTVRCHRAVVEPLARAMATVEAAGLADEVLAAGYDGCFVSRFLRSGASLSRHAWGIAVDLGFDDNRTGAAPDQDERLVEAFRAEGFTWGGTWLDPDPAHFEVVDPTP
jgi:hypothetical protein